MDKKKEHNTARETELPEGAVDSIEMPAGPDLEYHWYAQVARKPSPVGLEGGRVLYFSLSKFNDAPRPGGEPEMSDCDAYYAWIKSLPPRWLPVAKFEHGVLTVDSNDEVANSIIDEIKVKSCKSMKQEEIEEMALDAFLTLNEVCEPDITEKASKAKRLLHNFLMMANSRSDWSRADLIPMKQAEELLSNCHDEFESRASRECSQAAALLAAYLDSQQKDIEKASWEKAIEHAMSADTQGPHLLSKEKDRDR